MRVGIILQINVSEGAWNAIRFGTAALKEGHEVKIFLISAGVDGYNGVAEYSMEST